MSDLIERLLDNAATCSQERGMLGDGALRECVKINVADPLTARIKVLEDAIKYEVNTAPLTGESQDRLLEAIAVADKEST